MRWASSSATAVLPTPGSPISTGLFLLRRDSTWIRRRISLVAADHRIELAAASGRGELAAIALQGRGFAGLAGLAGSDGHQHRLLLLGRGRWRRAEQGDADARLGRQGLEQMGQIEQGTSLQRPAGVSLLKQVFEGIADVQGADRGRGLGGAEAFKLVERRIARHCQALSPAIEAGILQQAEQQMLHVHGAMAPTARLVLAGQQQVPGLLT
jgi:hypothetical protein